MSAGVAALIAMQHHVNHWAQPTGHNNKETQTCLSLVVVVVMTVCTGSLSITNAQVHLIMGSHVPVDMTPQTMCLCTQP